MRRILAIAVGLVAALNATGRGPDGELTLIETPNNGVPVVVKAGGTFEARLAGEADLALAGETGVFPLDAAFEPLPGGRQRAACRVPEDTPPGTYALEATAGGETDHNGRAVFVVAAFPETYTFAHLTDTHIGSNRHPRTSEAIMRDMAAYLNEKAPDFVVITGDLTENGTWEQHRAFMGLIDLIEAPVFVCPGNHDRNGLNYEHAFGPVTYRFWFGEDGYLSFDSKDFRVAYGAGPQDGLLERYRREIKPARWSIGLTHRYDADMGMRCQLALFVDNPLDHLFFGHYHRANHEGEDETPWGRTGITLTPAGIDGVVRFVQVTQGGIRPGPPEQAVPIGK